MKTSHPSLFEFCGEPQPAHVDGSVLRTLRLVTASDPVLSPTGRPHRTAPCVTASSDDAEARRRRALARLAKRRYLADTAGYERMEQVRRTLRVVG